MNDELVRTKAHRVGKKKCKIGSMGKLTVIAMAIKYDRERSIRIRCLNEDGDRTVSLSSSKVSTFSIVFVSSSKVFFCEFRSSSCKQEAYSGSHLPKPMVKKIWKNMKNHGMVCPPPPKSKRGQNPFRILP